MEPKPLRLHLDKRIDDILPKVKALPDDVELLSEKACARLLGVSTQFLQSGRYRGDERRAPPAFKLGSAIRYRKTEVLAWLERRRYGHD